MNKESIYLTEVDSWKDFRQGNRAAFEYLYNQYILHLYHYGNRLTPDRELIEDCIQDLFIELWQNRTYLGDTNSVKFYLFKALKRKLVKVLVLRRKQAASLALPETYELKITLSPEFDLISQQISQEQKDRLLGALNSLTKRQKEAITLKFYDGLSYQQVAELMSMGVPATYNLVYRGIDAMKTQLDHWVFLLILVSGQ